jgi:hypothetical protein
MDAGNGTTLNKQSVKLVRWLTGERHLTVDGLTTVCGYEITSDHVAGVEETGDWAEQVDCHDCAYRHTPPGYPRPWADFPLRRRPGRAGARRAGEKWGEAEHCQLIEMLRDGLPLADTAGKLGRGVNAVATRCQRMLVAATGASELDVAARFVELGIAVNTGDVVRRLGCAPGGTLNVRVRMAADRAAASVWVLVADGLCGRATKLDPKVDRHISLHVGLDDAQRTLNRLLTGHAVPDAVSVTFARRTVGEMAVGETFHQHDP